MERTHVEVVECRVGAQAEIASREIADQISLSEFAFVGQPRVSSGPIPLADIPGKILYCRLRRGGWAEQPGGAGVRQSDCGRVRVERADHDENYSCDRNGESKKSSCRAH